VLYGIGARLDERPELLFLLRCVDQQDLIAGADGGLRPGRKGPAAERVLETDDLSQMFGIEIAEASAPTAAASGRGRASARLARSVPKAAPAVPKAVPAVPKTAAPRRRALSAGKRAEISARMKAYWREFRSKRGR
jgi:hypothetical protein